MPARMDENYTIILPRGETFGLIMRNQGQRKFEETDKAEMFARNKIGAEIMHIDGELEDDAFVFRIPSEKSLGIEEGVYLWDIIVSIKASENEQASRKTVFAPHLRKLVIGKVADYASE